MFAAMAVQVLPNVEDDEMTVKIVDKVIEKIKEAGYSYEVGPFETTIEGDYDGLMDLYKALAPLAIEAGCEKVAIYSKLFCSKNRLMTSDEKVSKHR